MNDNMDDIGWIDSLTKQYGDGFYLFNEHKLRDTYYRFHDAFAAEYGNCQIAYSFKTCFVRPLLETLYELGSYAEVTSEYEYTLARQIGFTDSQIVYNGPYKNMQLAMEIAKNGGIVNLDSGYEVECFCQLAAEEEHYRVGIRCNFLVDGRPSRFGIDIESKEFDDVLKLLETNHIELIGLMCHIKTRALEDWQKKARLLKQCVLNVTNKYNFDKLEYIDIGGGYKFNAEMFSQYAKVIVDELHPFSKQGIKLILEPGAAICEGSMNYYAKVVNTNLVRDRKYATIAATIFDISAIRKYPPGPVRVISQQQTPNTDKDYKVIVVGFTCLEDDIIVNDILQDVQVGDYVVFENVGAYASALRPNFIRGVPAILALNEQGQVHLCRSKAPIGNLEGCVYEGKKTE